MSEFFMSLEKDPQQEEFLQGRMQGNPYSFREPGLGPLMRDIKNKICTGERGMEGRERGGREGRREGGGGRGGGRKKGKEWRSGKKEERRKEGRREGGRAR